MGLAAAVAAATLGLGACDRASPPPAPAPLTGKPAPPGPTPAPAATIPVTLGLPLESTSVLAILALKNGYFEAAGLKAASVEYVSGLRAFEALLQGKVDLAVVGDVPVAVKTCEGASFRIAATLAASNTGISVVARVDHGIARPADLRGKRVGVQRGSQVHFHLHMYLAKHGLKDNDVAMEFLKAEDLAPALIAGRLDAMCMREPFVGQALAALSDKATTFADPELYTRAHMLVASERLIQEHPQALRRALAALLRAEDFAASQAPAAQATVAKTLGMDPSAIQRLWGDQDLRVRLEQSLLPGLEDQAQWAMGSGLAPKGPTPNFLKLLYLDPLAELRPKAVTIIR